MRFTLTASIVLCLVFQLPDRLVAQETTAYNTELFGQINPGGQGAGGNYSGVWGYAAPDGREYALVGGFRGTYVVDVTEKPIRNVAFIPGPQSGWREIKSYGQYAYVVSEGGGGLQIIDLGGLPEEAVLVASDTSVFRTGHTISREGRFIYVHGSNIEAGANGGTLIFDIGDDPLAPRLVGTYEVDYVHDATIRGDTMYAAMITTGRLDIVDLGPDRTDPKKIGEITYPGAGTHNADLSLDGRFVFTTDEIGATPKTLKVWDIGDLDDIRKVADFTPVPNQTIHNVHVKGTVAYVSWYTAGTRILDISDPANPAEIGFYDTFPGASGAFAGNWEVHPYLPSGKILASDMQTGLHVFTFNGTKKGIARGTVRDSATGEPVPGARIELRELGRVIVADDRGRFEIAGAEDTLEFRAVAFNYRERTGTVALLSDVNDNADIVIAPLKLRHVVLSVVDSVTRDLIGRFAYELKVRGVEGANAQAIAQFDVPVDSSYSINIGAWGYLPRTIILPAGELDQIEVALAPGYVDDVELDLGWSLGDPNDDGVGGFWERGDPVETSLQLAGQKPVIVQPGDDHTPNGTKGFFTGLATSPSSPGGGDLDSGRVTLTSPLFDLTSYVDPKITIALWWSDDAFPFFEDDDRMYVRLSNDGGESWTDVRGIESGDSIWMVDTFRVADFIDPTERMLFRVVVSDSLEPGWVEAGVDDFAVLGERAASAPAERENLPLDLSIAPNPARHEATITIPNTTATILRVTLSDLLGRAVVGRELPADDGVIRVDLHDLSPGTYVVRLESTTGSARGSGILVVR